MENTINQFVEDYEFILKFKKEHKTELNQTKYYIHHILSIIVILTIFLLVGFFLNVNKNFSYVAFSINASIFGSFLFVKIMQEKDYQLKEETSYNVYTSVCMSMLRLAVILSHVTAILFYFVYPLVVNNITTLLLVILATILLLLYFLLSNYFFHDEFSIKTPLYIILFHQFYMIGYRMFVIESIMWNVIFWTALLLLLLLVHEILDDKGLTFIKPSFHRISVLHVIGLILLVLGVSSSIYNKDIRITNFVHASPVLTEEASTFSAPSLKYYESDEIYIGNGFIQLKEADDRDYVFKSPYISVNDIVYMEEDRLFIETITKQGSYEQQNEEVNHLIYEFVQGEFVEYSSEIEYIDFEYKHKSSELEVSNIFEGEITKVQWSNDFVYLSTEDRIIVYSKNYEFVKVFPEFSNTHLTTIIVNGNDTFIEIKERTELTYPNYLYTTKLYKLNDKQELHLVLETPSTAMANKSLDFKFVANEGNHYYYQSGFAIYEYDIESQLFTKFPLTTQKILYQDNQKVVLTKGATLEYRSQDSTDYYYSNGFVANYNINIDSVEVNTLEDFVNDNYNNTITLPIYREHSSDALDNFSIQAFFASDDRFGFCEGPYSLPFVTTYDLNGDFVEQIPFLDMDFFDKTNFEDGMLTTIYAIYADERNFDEFNYSVFTLDVNELSSIGMREDFNSFYTCDNPYGCDDNYGQSIMNQSLVQCFLLPMIILVLVLPNKWNTKELLEE